MIQNYLLNWGLVILNLTWKAKRSFSSVAVWYNIGSVGRHINDLEILNGKWLTSINIFDPIKSQMEAMMEITIKVRPYLMQYVLSETMMVSLSN